MNFRLSKVQIEFYGLLNVQFEMWQCYHFLTHALLRCAEVGLPGQSGVSKQVFIFYLCTCFINCVHSRVGHLPILRVVEKYEFPYSGFQIPAGQNFYLLQKAQTGSGTHLHPYLMDTGDSSSAVKRPRCETDHIPPFRL
jgi:hypothetical protein